MADLSKTLAAHREIGYVVAPAGFGKTHLIAASVLHAERRQLVLTHTYAGVNALRKKMRQLRVSSSAYHVDTIASWALRFSLAYPDASRWRSSRPEGEEWSALYEACSTLLDCEFARRIIRASYGGMYVDEYQDCSSGQHELIVKLARDLPCRILGDPLQGIFGFNGDAIDWSRDVAVFKLLGRLETPHRWQRAGEPALGEWLRDVRTTLEARRAVDLTSRPCRGLTPVVVGNDPHQLLIRQGNVCRQFKCRPGDTVIAIHAGEPTYKAKCHQLALSSRGRFSSIEEIEGRDVFAFLRRFEQASDPRAKLKRGVEFAETAMANVRSSLTAGTLRGEHVELRENTRSPNVARAANSFLVEPTSEKMADVLLAVRELPGVHVGRADLFNRVIGVLRKHALMPQATLAEAAEKYQTQFRHRGRSVGRRLLVGTTLLVKGLEFHHAIVLDASSLSRRELYVALTRGAKSLTIISSTSTLNPPA